jgi:hypothetical protein
MLFRNPDEDLRELERQAQSAGKNSAEDYWYLREKTRRGSIPELFIKEAAQLGDANAQRLLAEMYQQTRTRFRKSKLVLPKTWQQFNSILETEYLNRDIIPHKLYIYWISDMMKLLLRDISIVRTGKGGLIFKKPSEIQNGTLEILNLMSPYEKLTRDHDLSVLSLEIRENSYPFKNIIKIAKKLCHMEGGIERVLISYRERIDGFLQIAICNLAQAAICEITKKTSHDCAEIAQNIEDPLLSGASELRHAIRSWPWNIIPVETQRDHLAEAIHTIEEIYRTLIPKLFRQPDGEILHRIGDVDHLLLQRREQHLQLLADLLLGREWNRPN